MEGNHSYDPHVQRLYKCKTQRRKRHEAHKDGFGCDEHPETVVVSSGPQHHGTPRWLAGWLAGCRCELMQDIRSNLLCFNLYVQTVLDEPFHTFQPLPPSLPLHTSPCHTESQPSLHLPSFHSSRFYRNWNSERKSQDQSTNQPTNHQSRPQTLQPHTLARDTGKEERNGQRNGVGETRNGMGRGTRNGMSRGTRNGAGKTRNGMGR
ncbi:hypothetical protein Pcinc_018903 [Petrolisthes cinctipes]|uniref:Uncharacterized protein n=1 Tax=Petrolisthes cinctipes TaxID=88211 RepID=A0AAE1FM94_PETCI|nr:hypothetical protein Pcinc_018903 [Petrolisthes cinctipes]